MIIQTLTGILLPFFGTALGASCVFFMKKNLSRFSFCALNGFAAGVMVAASVWSLIIPAIEQSNSLKSFSFLPATVGFWLGIIFLFALGKVALNIEKRADNEVISTLKGKKTKMMILAVVIHNVPEGMAVGVVFAGLISGNEGITLAGATSLSIGIALQNFPEGAIVSMPLSSIGYSKIGSFYYGVLSGAVEPVGALIALTFAVFIQTLLPYFLGFAAGAMIFVVIKELIPETAEGGGENIGTLFFCVGFTVMMVLDVVFG